MNTDEIKKYLKDYANILNSLRSLKILRTYNSPVGDYSEWLVSQKMGLVLQRNSEKGYDAIDSKAGLKYQIKSRWMHPENNSRQLNVIRNYNENQFDYLIAVFFDEDFEVAEAYLIPHDIIIKYFPINKHQNGIVVTVNNQLICDSQVKDITALLR